MKIKRWSDTVIFLPKTRAEIVGRIELSHFDIIFCFVFTRLIFTSTMYYDTKDYLFNVVRH